MASAGDRVVYWFYLPDHEVRTFQITGYAVAFVSALLLAGQYIFPRFGLFFIWGTLALVVGVSGFAMFKAGTDTHPLSDRAKYGRQMRVISRVYTIIGLVLTAGTILVFFLTRTAPYFYNLVQMPVLMLIFIIIAFYFQRTFRLPGEDHV